MYRPRIRGHRVDGNWAECASEADLGDTEIAPPLLKIDPGASTALAPVGAPAELAHAARSRRPARPPPRAPRPSLPTPPRPAPPPPRGAPRGAAPAARYSRGARPPPPQK